MIEVITYTSIVILIIIVIYQKLTIWGLESEVESNQYLLRYDNKTHCENEALVQELQNKKEYSDHVAFHHMTVAEERELRIIELEKIVCKQSYEIKRLEKING
jgi:predicted Holliday junction resolvase-like endonuclease